MSQNICNICGANYEYHNGRWKCPACGAYKPEEFSNEEVTLLYSASQKLRLSDFDEAEKEYSDIIEKYPKNPNGYWGRLLSKYGIKYEEDFDGRKIPTCYAASMESVISDKDYLQAIALADAETRAYYTQQAGYMERVRKEWIEKAKKEKPYDIFICYKDSDFECGIERTKDSIAAQDLYIHLTKQGYRVFFSHECLRDKVGEKYEPYIFNALSTAKVMLVYGSKSEYITSKWLKNEWTRYEKRVQSGEKKPNSLLVACDGFSPAELPKALSAMQCFDANNRNFYSDLDETVKKIIKGEKKKKATTTENKKSKKAPIVLALTSAMIAVLLCVFLPNALKNGSTTSIKNPEFGIVITASENIFDENSAVVVDKSTDGAQHRAIVNAVNHAKSIELQNTVVYDIECSVNITNDVTIQAPYTQSLPNSTVKVFYVSDDQNLIEEHGCNYKNGIVEFKTSHLSYYVIGEVEHSQTDPSETADNTDVDTTKSEIENPQTTPTETTGSPSVTTTESKKETTTLYFNANGGSGTMSAQTIIVGESTDLTTCSFNKAGYTFSGWATTASGSVAYTDGASFNAESESEITLYAIWVPNSNSLVFNANGGSGAMESISITTNETIALPFNNFSKDGYTFLGWSDSQNGGVKYTDRQSFTMTSSTTVTLYAVWSANTNTINFDANGGTGPMSAQQAKTDEKVTLKQNSLSRKGYTFKGWSTTSDGVVAYADKAEYTMGTNASVTLYAVWEANSNKVVFNANGGSGSMNDQVILTGSKANLSACTFTREGFTFAGWATTSTGNAVYADNASYTMGDESSYTLYAVWIKVAYTITYHMNNGSNNVSNPARYDVNSETIVFADPTRDGYTFLGWYTDAAFKNKITSIPKGSTGNKDVYASWSANTNSINFNSNGGNGTMSAQQAKTDEKVTLKSNSFTRDGYTFAGWAITSGGTVVYADKADYTVGTSSSVTFYAIWEPIRYTITFDLDNGFFYDFDISEYSIESDRIVIPNPAKEGYTFIGWTGSDISEMQTSISIEEGMSGNKEYIAHWEKITSHPDGAEDFYYLSNGDMTYTITGYAGDGSSVFIPESYNGLIVNAIAPSAFKNCATFKEVIIGKNITTIGLGAFSGCSSLETITLPFVGKSISPTKYGYPLGFIFGEEAYSNSVATKQYYGGVGGYYHNTYSTYYIPKTLKTVNILGGEIYYGAFSNCELIESVTLPEGITEIGKNAFNICSGIKNIVIPNSVTTIGSGAFAGLTSLKSLTIPKNVSYIGEGAFDGCVNVENLYFNAIECSDFTAETNAFARFGKDGAGVHVVIGKDVKKIPAYLLFKGTFSGSSLKGANLYIVSLEFENGSACESVGKSSFSHCSQLLQVVLPNTISHIGAFAFYNCENLIGVTFKDTTTWYKEDSSILSNRMDVSSREMNADYLAFSYSSYDWYKI